MAAAAVRHALPPLYLCNTLCMYVREGRRMVGAYVFTQNDRQYNLSKQDSIGDAALWILLTPAPRAMMTARDSHTSQVCSRTTSTRTTCRE